MSKINFFDYAVALAILAGGFLFLSPIFVLKARRWQEENCYSAVDRHSDDSALFTWVRFTPSKGDESRENDGNGGAMVLDMETSKV